MQLNREIALLFGLSVLALARLLETFVPDKVKIQGKIVAAWTMNCLGISWFVVFALSLTEHYLVLRHFNWLAGIGLFLIAVRLVVKLWAMKALGDYWSIQVEIRDEQKLVSTGPYKYVRHPSYLSTMTELTAIPLIAGAYYTLIYVWLVHFSLILIRIHYEERELRRKFGSDYDLYRRRTFALLPLPKERLMNVI